MQIVQLNEQCDGAYRRQEAIERGLRRNPQRRERDGHGQTREHDCPLPAFQGQGRERAERCQICGRDRKSEPGELHGRNITS